MKHILQNWRDNKIPIYYLKFEELRDNPKACLTEICEFLLGVEDLTGTAAEKRIDEVLARGHEITQVYKLKSTDNKFNNISKYSKKQQDFILSNLHDFCQFFGYFKKP